MGDIFWGGAGTGAGVLSVMMRRVGGSENLKNREIAERMKLFRIAVRAVILLALSPLQAYGCDCDRQSVRSAFSRADIVFRGRVVYVTHGKRLEPGVVRFRVSRVWKGEVPAIFEMGSIVESSDCVGFYPDFLKPGKELLVYAVKGPVESPVYLRYQTESCSRTAFANEAGEDLKVLGEGRQP